MIGRAGGVQVAASGFEKIGEVAALPHVVRVHGL